MISHKYHNIIGLPACREGGGGLIHIAWSHLWHSQFHTVSTTVNISQPIRNKILWPRDTCHAHFPALATDPLPCASIPSLNSKIQRLIFSLKLLFPWLTRVSGPVFYCKSSSHSSIKAMKWQEHPTTPSWMPESAMITTMLTLLAAILLSCESRGRESSDILHKCACAQTKKNGIGYRLSFDGQYNYSW